MSTKVAAHELVDPFAKIHDYGTSFLPGLEHSSQLHTPPLFLPPEDFFDELITLAADIWTLALSLYEVLGERTLFESFSNDRDDILADAISTLGQLPPKWWNAWEGREDFFEQDGSWRRNIQSIRTPVFRPLHQRLWDMGRGETPETCEWDLAGGELRALEELLKAMLSWDPEMRPSAQQLLDSEYMLKWAMPAWRQQQARARSRQTNELT